MDFGFTQEQQKLIDRVNQLVQQRIAPRAAQYDQSFEAPIADIQDLIEKAGCWRTSISDAAVWASVYTATIRCPFFSSTSIWPTAILRRRTASRYTTTH